MGTINRVFTQCSSNIFIGAAKKSTGNALKYNGNSLKVSAAASLRNFLPQKVAKEVEEKMDLEPKVDGDGAENAIQIKI